MRSAIGTLAPRLRRAIACWMPTAAAMPALGAPNTAIIPSPRPLTMVPRFSSTSRADQLVVLPPHLVGLVVADPTAHRGRVDEVGEEHRHGCCARLESRHRAESYDGWRRPLP